jgi:hypothetical protein
LAEGFQAAEFGFGFLGGLFGEGDTALEAPEDGAGFGEGFAEFDSCGRAGLHGVIFSESGLDAEIAAEEPLATDDRIDLEAL